MCRRFMKEKNSKNNVDYSSFLPNNLYVAATDSAKSCNYTHRVFKLVERKNLIHPKKACIN